MQLIRFYINQPINVALGVVCNAFKFINIAAVQNSNMIDQQYLMHIQKTKSLNNLYLHILYIHTL